MNSRILTTALITVVLPLSAQVAVGPAVKLSEVVVTPSRFGVADVATTAVAALTAAELEVLPQVGDDLFRSIARLPGLATDDVSARFWVRGAPQSEVWVRLDGADVLLEEVPEIGDWASLVGDEHRPVWVATVDGVAAGFLAAEVRDHVLRVRQVFVHPGARELGLGDDHAFLNTPGAVILGLTYGFLPFMVLPLYAAIERMDPTLVEASYDLGLGRVATFRRVILPSVMPGLVAGTMLVFIPALGD